MRKALSYPPDSRHFQELYNTEFYGDFYNKLFETAKTTTTNKIQQIAEFIKEHQAELYEGGDVKASPLFMDIKSIYLRFISQTQQQAWIYKKRFIFFLDNLFLELEKDPTFQIFVQDAAPLLYPVDDIFYDDDCSFAPNQPSILNSIQDGSYELMHPVNFG